MAGPTGLEPATSTVTVWRSSQLSYGPNPLKARRQYQGTGWAARSADVFCRKKGASGEAPGGNGRAAIPRLSPGGADRPPGLHRRLSELPVPAEVLRRRLVLEGSGPPVLSGPSPSFFSYVRKMENRKRKLTYGKTSVELVKYLQKRRSAMPEASRRRPMTRMPLPCALCRRRLPKSVSLPRRSFGSTIARSPYLLHGATAPLS